MIRPLGLTRAVERLHALQRVGMHHVARHGFARKFVSLPDACLELRIKQSLSHFDRNLRL